MTFSLAVYILVGIGIGICGLLGVGDPKEPTKKP